MPGANRRFGNHPVTNAFTLASFGGAPTQAGGDTISLTFTDPALQSGVPYMVTYTTLANLQMPGAMGGLAQAVNADPNLLGFGILGSGVGPARVMVIQSNPTGNTTIGQSGGISAGGIGATTTNTFAPNTTPVYSLGEDDYIVQESSVGINLGVTPGGPALRSGAAPITDGFTDDPLHIVRSTPADANNMIEVECLDRQNNYNTAVAEAFDQGSIDVYGVRRDTSTKVRLITDPLYVGGMVAQLLLQRQLLYRNTYTFKLGWKYILLEPMDLVSDHRFTAWRQRLDSVDHRRRRRRRRHAVDHCRRFLWRLFADRPLPAGQLFATRLALDPRGGRRHCGSSREAGEWQRGRRVRAELERPAR